VRQDIIKDLVEFALSAANSAGRADPDVDHGKVAQAGERSCGNLGPMLKRDLVDGAEHHRMSTGNIHEPLGLLRGVDQRLLDKSVYARFDRKVGKCGMGGSRRTDMHCIDAALPQEIRRVVGGHSDPQSARRRFCSSRIGIDDCHELRI
jgi:hypothetical protein